MAIFMLPLKFIYLFLFVFCTWLALATRSHQEWFHPTIVKYGGDVIWSGMFVFFLRIFFIETALWKLALINYALGVLIECSQLSDAGWMLTVRHTYLGRLLLGVGFVWSDLICYAMGTMIAWGICLLADKIKPITRSNKFKEIPGIKAR